MSPGVDRFSRFDRRGDRDGKRATKVVTDTPTSSMPGELPIVDVESPAAEDGQRVPDRPAIEAAPRAADGEHLGSLVGEQTDPGADLEPPPADADCATTVIERVHVDVEWLDIAPVSTTADRSPAVEDDDDATGDGESTGPRHADVPRHTGGRHRRAEPPRPPWAARPRLLGAVALIVAVVAAGIALVIPAVFAGS